MTIKKEYCGLCETHYYGGFLLHYNSRGHQNNLKVKRRIETEKNEAQQKKIDFDLLLASALEGYTLNPGDEVQLRNGQSFKVDIHGDLFEIPDGS